MSSQPSVPLCEWTLHRNVYVPGLSATWLIDGPPGRTMLPVSLVLRRVPSLVADSPGLMIHRSWTEPAVAAGKFQRTVSPTVAVSALGSQWSGHALLSTVLGALPPPVWAGSAADSRTLTGPL